MEIYLLTNIAVSAYNAKIIHCCIFVFQVDPEMLYAEYCFNEKIDISKTGQSDKKKMQRNTAKMLNALMNTSGGLFVLQCGESDLDKNRDEWLQSFKHWIPSDLYSSLVTVRYKTVNKQIYIILFVKKSPKLVPFSYNAYWRHAAGKELITSENMIKNLIQKTEETCPEMKPLSRLKGLLLGNGSFTLDKVLPVEYREVKQLNLNDTNSMTSKLTK